MRARLDSVLPFHSLPFPSLPFTVVSRGSHGLRVVPRKQVTVVMAFVSSISVPLSHLLSYRFMSEVRLANIKAPLCVTSSDTGEKCQYKYQYQVTIASHQGEGWGGRVLEEMRRQTNPAAVAKRRACGGRSGGPGLLWASAEEGTERSCAQRPGRRGDRRSVALRPPCSNSPEAKSPRDTECRQRQRQYSSCCGGCSCACSSASGSSGGPSCSSEA